MKTTDLKNALRKAKYHYETKHLRHYDLKQRTWNPADKEINIMSHVNELIEGYGICTINMDPNSFSYGDFMYVNLGSQDSTTICFNYHTGRYEYKSWVEMRNKAEQYHQLAKEIAAC